MRVHLVKMNTEEQWKNCLSSKFKVQSLKLNLRFKVL